MLLVTLLTGTSFAAGWHFDPNDPWTDAFFDALREEAVAAYDAELLSKLGLEHSLTVGEAQALADWIEQIMSDAGSTERGLYIDAMQASITGMVVRSQMRGILAKSQVELFKLLDMLTIWLESQGKNAPSGLIFIDPGFCAMPGLDMLEMCRTGQQIGAYGTGTDGAWIVSLTQQYEADTGHDWSYDSLWETPEDDRSYSTDVGGEEADGLCPVIYDAEGWSEGGCDCQSTYWTDDNGDGEHDDGEVGFCPQSCVPMGPIIQLADGSIDYNQLYGWMPQQGLDIHRAMTVGALELAAIQGLPVSVVMTANSGKQIAVQVGPDGTMNQVACGTPVDVAMFAATSHLEALQAGESVDIPEAAAAELQSAAILELSY